MLRKIFVLIFALVLTLGRGTLANCPHGCTCAQTTATCDTLNLGPFTQNITILNIINPKQPLILKGQPFNVTGLRGIKDLSISNATILGLDKTHFAGLSSLKTLTITNSTLDLIDPFTFYKTNIKQLKITNSSLSSFDYINSNSLEEIDLSGCHLKAVSKNSFATLTNLSYINLANNHIEEVDPLAFANVVYLQEINLSSNKITKLHPNVFKNNEDLATVDLSNNPIISVDVFIYAELEKLVLRSLHLKEFGKGLQKTVSLLSYLDLADNNIDPLKVPFANMPQLEYIDLSNNKLTTLPPKLFQSNDEIQKLILDNNNFGVLPKLYGNFDTSSFSCKDCQLTSIPADSFKEFRPLIILNLSSNKLTSLKHWLWFLPNLVDLDLSHNKLSSISPLAFANSTSLGTVNLAHNPLVSIETSLFTNNKLLNTLDLSFCHLERLWSDHATKLAALRVLNLAHNSLTTIEPNRLALTPVIAVLILSNNSLTCDTNLRDSLLWLDQHSVSSERNSWKRSEEIGRDAASFEEVAPWNWKDLAKQLCPESYYKKNFEEHEKEIEAHFVVPQDVEVKPLEALTTEIYIDDVDDYEYEDMAYNDHDQKMTTGKKEELESTRKQVEIDLIDLSLPSTHHKTEKTALYPVWWLALVFSFTALSVLIIVVNVLLLLLKSKMLPRNVALPHIKIPSWNNGIKLKKHSGSVYRPLSEERAEMLPPVIVPTHVSFTKPSL